MRYAAAGLMLLALSACSTSRIELADFVPPQPTASAAAFAEVDARPSAAIPSVVTPVAANGSASSAMVASAADMTRPAKTHVDSKLTTAALPYADSDPHHFTGIAPGDYPVHGIDISKYQGNIDWPKLRAHDISFVYIKATEGGDHMDERFSDYWQAASRHDIPRGAYHFYYFCRSGASQARWFIRNVPKDATALPPVLDIEWNPDSPSCRKRPSPAVVRREIKAFVDVVERHFGKRPMIYTTPDFYRDNQLAGAFPRNEFWLRSVAGHPDKVYPDADNWRFWQYTGTGIVPGIRGKTDIDAFSGSLAEWRDWLKANKVRID